MGEVIAGDFHSYRYLVESIRKFPNQVSCKFFKQEFLNYFVLKFVDPLSGDGLDVELTLE